MPTLRIGIDARISRDWRTGVGRLTIELVAAMAPIRPQHRFLVLTAPEAPRVPIEAPNVDHEKIDCAIASVRQAIGYQTCTRHLGIDVLFFTHPLAAPVLDGAPGVGLILDVYPLLFPSDYATGVALYYRTLVSMAERRKKAILAISEASRRDAIRYLHLPAERVQVLHLAASAAFRRHEDRTALAGRLGALGLPPDYVLYVGNFRPHKNIPRLLEAIAVVAARKPSVSLVIAGGVERGRRGLTPSNVAQLAAALGIADSVIQIGMVSDETLVDLYNGAAVVAIPSLYEGFGLPALEAMACGAAVVASRAGALEELVGTAGLLVDPRDSASLAEALLAVMTDSSQRQSLQEASIGRAREFSWQAAAHQLLATIESAAS